MPHAELFYDFLVRLSLSHRKPGYTPVLLRRYEEWSITVIKNFTNEITERGNPYGNHVDAIYRNAHKIKRHALKMLGGNRIYFQRLSRMFLDFGMIHEVDKVSQWYHVTEYGYPNPKGSVKTMLYILELDEKTDDRNN